MSTWATPTDVLNRWVGDGAPAQASDTLLTFIADAEDEILRHFPKIQERIDRNELPLRRVQRVIADVVIRAYKVGNDYRSSYSETTGPFSHSGSYSDNTPRSVKLTESDIAALAPDEQQTTMLNMAPYARAPFTDYYDDSYFDYPDLYDRW